MCPIKKNIQFFTIIRNKSIQVISLKRFLIQKKQLQIKFKTTDFLPQHWNDFSSTNKEKANTTENKL